MFNFKESRSNISFPRKIFAKGCMLVCAADYNPQTCEK